MRTRWTVLGALLVIGGAVAFGLTGGDTAGEFGWFAYAPLTAETYRPAWGVYLNAARVAAAVVVLAGVVVLAFTAGRWWERRDRPMHPSQPLSTKRR